MGMSIGCWFRGLIPFDVWVQIFDLLPIKELLQISQTCKVMAEAMKEYWWVAFNFRKLVMPFIPNKDVDSFQEMLHNMGAVISRSMALQFMDRGRASEMSEMDVYVCHDERKQVVAWLIGHGCVMSCPAEDGIVEDDVTHGYKSYSHIECVEDFKTQELARIVQLISTKQQPIFAILKFHSCRSLITDVKVECWTSEHSMCHELHNSR